MGNLVRLFIEPGDEVVSSLGAYPTFKYHVDGFGGNISLVPYNNYYEDLDGLVIAAKKSKAKILYLSNPDNPMGTFHPKDHMQDFIDKIPGKKAIGDITDDSHISTASEGAYCGIFFEEQNKKLSEIFVNAIQNSNMQRILWISKKEPRNNILEIDNLTYIKHSSENDYFNTVLSLEEVEEVNEKFIDLK